MWCTRLYRPHESWLFCICSAAAGFINGSVYWNRHLEGLSHHYLSLGRFFNKREGIISEDYSRYSCNIIILKKFFEIATGAGSVVKSFPYGNDSGSAFLTLPRISEYDYVYSFNSLLKASRIQIKRWCVQPAILDTGLVCGLEFSNSACVVQIIHSRSDTT